MGAKAMSVGENPEDWNIHHHFRSQSDCWSPPRGLLPALPPPTSASAGDEKDHCFSTIDSPTDEPGPEPEGEVKVKESERIDGLVKQLEDVIMKFEASDNEKSQRLGIAEKSVASLNAKLDGADNDRSSKAAEIIALSEKLAKLEKDTEVLLQKKEELAQRLASREQISVEDYQAVKEQYEALQQESESQRLLLQTQVGDCHEKLKSEAERVAVTLEEKRELTCKMSTLKDRLVAIETASTSRVVESAKVLEVLEKREQDGQKLLVQRQEAIDRANALEAKLQEYVSLEEYQTMKAQYQAVQQDFETHKASSNGKVSSLEASLQEEVSKYQSQLSVERDRLEAATKENAELSQTVSSLREQLTAMQNGSVARAEENADMMGRLDKQYQEILSSVQEKQQLVAQLAAQNSVSFEDHQSLQKAYQKETEEFEAHKSRAKDKIEKLEASLAKHDEKSIAEAQRFEALEQERDNLSQSVSTLNEQITNMQATSTSRSIESAKVLQLLAKTEQGNEEWLKEKQQLLEQIATKNAKLLDTIALGDHQTLKRQHQTLQQEFDAHKENSVRQVAGLEVSVERCSEQLRSEEKRVIVVQKERDDLSVTVALLNEKIATLQNASAGEAVENANVLEQLGTQYQDIYKLVQEKQKKLAKLAAQESVPFDYYQNAKKEYQILHQEFESYKIGIAEQMGSLEASRKAEVSKCEAQLRTEACRFEALQRERNELFDTVATLNAQINSMQTASTSQAVESAHVLERLARQYKDIFQVVQEKQQVLAGLAAEEARHLPLQDCDASEELQASLDRNKNLVQEMDALHDRNRALQKDLDASKVEASSRIVKLETTIQEKEKQQRDSQAKLNSESRRLSALERERNDLSNTVSALNDKIASMHKKDTSSSEEQKKISDRLLKREKEFNEVQRDKQAVLAKLEAKEILVHDLQAHNRSLMEELEAIRASGLDEKEPSSPASPASQMKKEPSSPASPASPKTVTLSRSLKERLDVVIKQRNMACGSDNNHSRSPSIAESASSMGSEKPFVPISQKAYASQGTGVLETRRTSSDQPAVAVSGESWKQLPLGQSQKQLPLGATGTTRQPAVPRLSIQEAIRRGRTGAAATATPSACSRQSSTASSASQRSPSAPLNRQASTCSSIGTASEKSDGPIKTLHGSLTLPMGNLVSARRGVL